MLENLIATLKADPRTIVFTEGPDPRILEAASRLKKDGILTSILIGNVDEVKAAAEKCGFDIEGIEIIDPATYPEMDAMVAKMVELRKGKMSEEDCRKALSKGNYFGTMLVKMGKADALLGGATYSTADTVRPALQIIKTKPGNKIVSSCFILHRPAKDGGDEKYAMGDCAININPGEDDLVEIAIETARTAKAFRHRSRRLLCCLTPLMGSGKGDTVDMMRNATAKVQGSCSGAGCRRRAAVRRCFLSGCCSDQVQGFSGCWSGKHLHLPGHQRWQHRLQDRSASGRLRGIMAPFSRV